ncbi:MAG: transcription termination factor NusA [Clostridia bacterium]|nr:transcription termination factor NusA [Clostridia bacterium]
MNADLIAALDVLESERGIDKEFLLQAIEAALVSAYRTDGGPSHSAARGNINVLVDRESGDIHMYRSSLVVEEVEDQNTQISLAEARKINPIYEPGDMLEQEVPSQNFGRIAAQTAKQVIVQRIREVERGKIFEEFAEKENEMLTAIVQRVEKDMVFVELGKTEGILFAKEQLPGEEYHANDRLRVYVTSVHKDTQGAQVMVSRIHPGLLKRLLELEVPEIAAGTVVVKAVAREAGSRSKVAVHSLDPAVDATGACIGRAGQRIEHVVEELRGEKVDIIEWSADPARFIAKALSPTRVLMVYINEEDRSARVIVPDHQLSLAIGKEGQNARLAARLTGWKIDIKPQSTVAEELEAQALVAPSLEDDLYDGD